MKPEEQKTFALSIGKFVAEQLAPLQKRNADLVEQIAAIQNQIMEMRATIEGLQQKAAPLRTKLGVAK